MQHEESKNAKQNQLLKDYNEWLTNNNLLGNLKEEKPDTLWKIFCGTKGIVSKLPRQSCFDFWSLINSKICKVSKNKFEDGHFTDAVETAFKKYNKEIKNFYKKKSGTIKDGKDLMMQFFKEDFSNINIASHLESEHQDSFQEGFKFISAGVMQALRNPRAHDILIDSKEEAIHLIFLASWLMNTFEKSI